MIKPTLNDYIDFGINLTGLVILLVIFGGLVIVGIAS